MVEREMLALLVLVILSTSIILVAMNIGRGASYLIALIVLTLLLFLDVAVIVNPSIIDLIMGFFNPRGNVIYILHVLPNTKTVRFADIVLSAYRELKLRIKPRETYSINYSLQSVKLYGDKIILDPAEAVVLTKYAGGVILTGYYRLVIPIQKIIQLASDDINTLIRIYSDLVDAGKTIKEASQYNAQVSVVLMPRPVSDIRKWIERFYNMAQRVKTGEKTEFIRLLETYLRRNEVFLNLTIPVIIISVYGRNKHEALIRLRNIAQSLKSNLKARHGIMLEKLTAPEIISVQNAILGKPPLTDEEYMMKFSPTINRNIYRVRL